MRRSLRFDLLIVAGLFVLPVAFFWQVTIGSKTLLPADNLYQFQPWAAYREQEGVPAVPHNALLSDLVLENLPWKQFIRDSIANHEIPLWNPYIFAGVPFLAAGQNSALYPFSVIYYVLPLDKAYGWFTVSQLWLAGLFMYLFIRGLGIRRFGAVLAAIAYQMSGFFVASVVFQMIIAAAAWLPFLLLMVEFTIRQRPLFGKQTVIPWIALGAIGLGCEILAGHVEITYYTLLVMGFWAACRLGWMLWQSWRSKSLGNLWRKQVLNPALALIALVVLGLGIGAVQFIPLLELVGHNFRQGSASFAEVRSYAFPPRHALAFLMPNLYGSPAQHEYIDVFSGHIMPFAWQNATGSQVTDSYWEVGKNYVEGACYVGILTLVLAIIALLNARFERSPEVRIESAGPYRSIFSLLSFISLLFVFGTPAYAILYYGLPGVSQLHSPFRWVFPLTLCLAALAGFGAEALQRAVSPTPNPSPVKREGPPEGISPSPREEGKGQGIGGHTFTYRLIPIVANGLMALGGLVLVALILSRVFYAQLSGPLDKLFHALAGADAAFPNVQTFYSVEFAPVLVFGVFLLLSGIVISLSRRQITLPRWLGRLPAWQALALAILALDLVMATAGFNPAADPKWLEFEPPAITWLKQHDPSQWRYIAVQGPGTTKTMNANVGWLYGLQDVAGYDSIIPKQYVDYMQQITPQGQTIYNRIAPISPDNLDALNSPYLNLLSVKYVVSEVAIDTTKYSQYKQVYQDSGVRIYENTQSFPRAYLGNSLCINLITGKDSIPNRKVSVDLVEVTANQITINATDTDPDFNDKLVLADSNFPGWRAYLRPQGAPDDQEREVPITPSSENFRSVQLPPGNWTVRFRYSPPTFQIGGFTSFIAGVVIVFALLIWLWQVFYVEQDGETSSVHRVAKNSIAPIALNFFNRAIDFVFALIMLRVLGPADAGIYYYAVVLWSWFDTITNFGLNILLTREVAKDRSSARRYLFNSTVLRLALAAAGVPVLAIFLAINYLIRPADFSAAQFQLAVLAVALLYVGLVPNSISYGLTALFYAYEKAEVPAAVSTVSAILKAVLGLGVLLAGWGVLGLAGVSIILNLITLAILSFQSRGLMASDPTAATMQPAHLDRTLIRDMVIASWPLMLNNLLAGLFFKIDVTLLEPLKGSDVVGKYGAAYKWIDALGIIPSLFTMALLPIMSRQAKEDKPGLQRSYYFAVKLLVCLALPIAVMLTFLAPFLIGLLGGDKYLPDGAIALQIMIWFAPVGWINSLTNYVLIALDQQKAMRWAFIVGVSFNVIANLIFIPLYSYVAAAVITILSEVVLQIMFYRLLRKALGPMPWIALLWKPVVAAALMLITLLILFPFAHGAVISVVILVVAGAIYPGALVVLRPFTDWELERIAMLMPRSMRRIKTLPSTVS